MLFHSTYFFFYYIKDLLQYLFYNFFIINICITLTSYIERLLSYMHGKKFVVLFGEFIDKYKIHTIVKLRYDYHYNRKR